MTSRLTRYEKETVLLCSQSSDPVTISTYAPGRRGTTFQSRWKYGKTGGSWSGSWMPPSMR